MVVTFLLFQLWRAPSDKFAIGFIGIVMTL